MLRSCPMLLTAIQLAFSILGTSCLLSRGTGSFKAHQTDRSLASEWVAQTIQRNRSALPFASFLSPDTILVPTPKSSLGKEVAQVLSRVRPLRKAALSAPENRPLPKEHYGSMEVQKLLPEPSSIVLVDDIVTRGSTLLGAASRLAEAFPKTKIFAFAAMRAITSEEEFDQEYSPVIGKILLRSQGDTPRRP